MDTTIDPFYQHSVLESQSGVGKAEVMINELPKSNVDGDKSEVVRRIDIRDTKESRDLRWSTWWLIGAVLIVIPWVAIAASAPKTAMGGIRTTGFLIWIEILWTSVWILSFFHFYIGRGWFWLCQFDASLMPWDTFLTNIMRTNVWFAMSLVAWGSSSVMCRVSGSTCNENWLMVLRKVLLASIPATATFCAEDILMEVIITFQAARMGRERHLETMVRRRNAIFLIAAIYLRVKEKEGTSQEPPVNSAPAGSQGSRCRSFASRLPSRTGKFLGTLFLRDPPDLKDVREQGKRYVQGKGSDKEFDLDGKPFPDIFVEHYLHGESMSFTEAFLQEKINEEAGKTINNALDFTAAEIMKMMDKDDSGEITTDEVADFLKELVMAMRDIAKSVNGMKRAARSANAVVSFLLLFVVAIIYAAFFVKNLTSYLTPIWTTVTGLSFALSGTVTEFIAACQFVFSKQPYDVGDRVIIEEKELIVEKVCLLYTVFHRCSDCAVEQIAHKKICDAWITNLTRSKGLFIKEVASIADKTDKFTSAQLEAHEKGLVAFINEETVRRRYLDVGGVKVSLHAEQRQLVADIKLNELMVSHEKVLSRMRGQIRDWLERLVREGGGTSSSS
ncbi:hypothetical protein B0T12DRAFT_415991 [Alternaria alternata]|nr:hypothetical protein B0T12DRAFT_415991 [Alternaria alternata]RYN87576.1 hypothetical protein AA0120_g7234 [Alternaria tenuissima]